MDLALLDGKLEKAFARALLEDGPADILSLYRDGFDPVGWREGSRA